MGAERKDRQEGEATVKISHISTSTSELFPAELSQLRRKLSSTWSKKNSSWNIPVRLEAVVWTDP